jgi:hypothetical protein
MLFCFTCKPYIKRHRRSLPFGLCLILNVIQLSPKVVPYTLLISKVGRNIPHVWDRVVTILREQGGQVLPCFDQLPNGDREIDLDSFTLDLT